MGKAAHLAVSFWHEDIVIRTLIALGALMIALGAAASAGEYDQLDVEVTHPIGGVWNEYANPGEDYPPSLDVRAWATAGDYDVSLEYHRNVYLTQSAGPRSLTRYATLTGGYATVTPFLARDTEFEARVMRRIRHHPLAVGLATLATWNNYPYPRLHGVGAGIAKLPDWTGPHVALFGSAFYYPAASGTLGPVHATFSILRSEVGFRFRPTGWPVYLVGGYQNEIRSGRHLPVQVRLNRSDPFIGLGARL
jgi:hypothetical protein